MPAELKLGETVHWAGPGQWRSYCERVELDLTQEQLDVIAQPRRAASTDAAAHANFARCASRFQPRLASQSDARLQRRWRGAGLTWP